MNKLFAWLGVAMLGAVVSTTVAHAQASEPLKPYVVFMLDTSGSMTNGVPAGTPPPSCGGANNRINHARCAINKIVNSYGDMVFALGRFRETGGGTFTNSCDVDGDASGGEGDQCTTAGVDCSACNCDGAGGGCGGGCTATMRSDARAEMLTGLVDGGNDAAGVWTDFECGSCGGQSTPLTSQPEIWGTGSWTPLGGSLLGAGRYWRGLQATDNSTIWPAGEPGFNPIVNDPLATQFLPVGCNPSPTCTSNCCVSQCRPYITILLTDGDETCGGNARTAAASMLTTDVTVGGVTRRYRIETKPIGFGITPGDGDIEAIAQSGGEPNGPGNEGFYASDEASLQLAISNILDDAIRTEVCNNLDDDCDALVDEGFAKGGMCDNGQLGVCRTTGTLVCRADGAGVQCNAPVGPAPGTETCNMLDDDCDGKVDEGLGSCMCQPQAEQCDNDDDDCDGRIDEGLTRSCGSGTCLGVETCVAGSYGGCTAQPSTAETCNGLDDNCDGVVDGLTSACSNMVTPGGPATDNPGGNPASACSMLGAACICRPGNRNCPPGGGGVFGACLGEQTPLTEVCNNLDDDCDGRIDEGTGGADCSTNCGTGTTVCTGGVLMCNQMSEPDDDTCDGNDDDCDGNVDEDYMGGGECGVGAVCDGMEQCINGMIECIGDPILPESCNCGDDDCDTLVDEGSLCPSGASCVDCQCAFRCSPGEFPCPAGKTCNDEGFCVADACFGVDCPPVNGNAQTCVQMGNAGMCVNTCDTVTCGPGTVCVPSTGNCAPDDCTTFPDRCTATQNCVAGVCIDNPCQGVTCTDGRFCVEGQCREPCSDITCADGERCREGMCEADPCGRPCPFGQVCDDDSGTCIENNCDVVVCPQGEACNPNNNFECEPDACITTMCPDPTDVCLLGDCYDPSTFAPDAGVPIVVTTGGGGGGGCATGGSDVGFGALLALLALRRRRMRRTGGRA